MARPLAHGRRGRPQRPPQPVPPTACPFHSNARSSRSAAARSSVQFVSLPVSPCSHEGGGWRAHGRGKAKRSRAGYELTTTPVSSAPRRLHRTRPVAPSASSGLDPIDVHRNSDGCQRVASWRAHGRGKAKRSRAGYAFIHSAVDDHSRLAYYRSALQRTRRKRHSFAAPGVRLARQPRCSDHAPPGTAATTDVERCSAMGAQAPGKVGSVPYT